MVGVDIGKPKKRQLDLDNEILNAIKSSEEEEKDEYRLFCLSLVPKLRRIAQKSKKQASEAQLKIQTMLIEYESDNND